MKKFLNFSISTSNDVFCNVIAKLSATITNMTGPLKSSFDPDEHVSNGKER